MLGCALMVGISWYQRCVFMCVTTEITQVSFFNYLLWPSGGIGRHASPKNLSQQWGVGPTPTLATMAKSLIIIKLKRNYEENFISINDCFDGNFANFLRLVQEK